MSLLMTSYAHMLIVYAIISLCDPNYLIYKALALNTLRVFSHITQK